MEEITYLLGAGASANVLPLIKENKESGNPGLANALGNFVDASKNIIISNNSSMTDILGKLDTIVKKCKAFGTPDLAAKNYLELQDKGNYQMLKLLLSAYFQYTEDAPNIRGTGFEGLNLDYRVMPFLTTISHKGKLPPGLKIVTWNYDTQIERGAKRLHPVGNNSNDFTEKFHVWPFNGKPSDKFNKDYFLLHLNGVCGSLYSEQLLGEKNTFPFNFSQQSETLLSFAWEDDSTFEKRLFTESRIELAKQMIDKTTILVVIGYSFPFFNRKIDAELFKAMNATLKKIYFQDPYLNGQFLYSQFGLFKDNRDSVGYPQGRVVEIEHIKNKDQYYVPFEL